MANEVDNHLRLLYSEQKPNYAIDEIGFFMQISFSERERGETLPFIFNSPVTSEISSALVEL